MVAVVAGLGRSKAMERPVCLWRDCRDRARWISRPSNGRHRRGKSRVCRVISTSRALRGARLRCTMIVCQIIIKRSRPPKDNANRRPRRAGAIVPAAGVARKARAGISPARSAMPNSSAASALSRHPQFPRLRRLLSGPCWADGAGRFSRSAHYAHASDEDLDHLAGMGIGAIVDLRRPEERTRMPSRRWTDFNAELIENHDDDEGAGKEKAGTASWRTGTLDRGVRDYHRRYYERAPTLPRLHDLYARLASSRGRQRRPDRRPLRRRQGPHGSDRRADPPRRRRAPRRHRRRPSDDQRSRELAIHAPVWTEEIAPASAAARRTRQCMS